MSEESQDKKRLTIPEKMFHAQKKVKRTSHRSMYFLWEDVSRSEDDNQLLRDIYASDMEDRILPTSKISIFLRERHLTCI